MRRGEIWWASLAPPRGSEPGFRRPVVIVSSDSFNDTPIRTVIAVAISSNLRLAESPGNIRFSRRSTGLPRDSVANVSQVLTLDKRVLSERVGTVPAPLLRELEQGLRLVLAL